MWQHVGDLTNREEAPPWSMCFQTQHGSEMVIADSVFIMNWRTAAWNWNGDITRMHLNTTNGSQPDVQNWPTTVVLPATKQTATSLNCPSHLFLCCPPLQWCQRVITLEFNKTICYPVKANIWFFFLIVLCSGLEENRNWLKSLRWFLAQIAKSGCSARERAAQRRLITAWPGKATQLFFRPAVSRWKPAVFFFKELLSY